MDRANPQKTLLGFGPEGEEGWVSSAGQREPDSSPETMGWHSGRKHPPVPPVPPVPPDLPEPRQSRQVGPQTADSSRPPTSLRQASTLINGQTRTSSTSSPIASLCPPVWASEELLARTQRIWLTAYGRPIRQDEAEELLRTLRHLTEVLFAMADSDGEPEGEGGKSPS